MWLKRKPRNRRLGREFVLDVKLRSSQVRAARARMAGLALAIVVGVVLSVYLLWQAGGWALNRLVYENNAFSIDEIDVQTDGIIPLEQLRRWTGVRSGENLLALDLAKVIRDLKLVSLVKSVSAERILPHTLRVRVIEREPVAQLNFVRPRSGGGLETVTYEVDAEGYVMMPLEPQRRSTVAAQPPEPLPILRPVGAAEALAGRRLESPQIQAALQFLVAFDHSPMASLVDLRVIDVSSPDVLLVSTAQSGEVTFGLLDPEQQLRRWQRVFEEGQKLGKAIATLDLAVTNNVPATWLEASALATPPPKHPKLLKKKHV